MSATVVEEPEARPGLAASLLPIMGVVFVGFLVIGVAMPVLPFYVHDGLGFGTFVVGLVAGSQFAASLISRPWAGHYSDGRGAKRAVVLGCSRPPRPGCSTCCSLLIRRDPEASVAVLLLGRGRARRSGKLHHHCRGQLGIGDRRSPKHRQGHRLGGIRDVRRLRDRRAGRLCALRRLRFCSDCARHGTGSAWRRCCSLRLFPLSCRCRAPAYRSPKCSERCGYRVSARRWAVWGSAL